MQTPWSQRHDSHDDSLPRQTAEVAAIGNVFLCDCRLGVCVPVLGECRDVASRFRIEKFQGLRATEGRAGEGRAGFAGGGDGAAPMALTGMAGGSGGGLTAPAGVRGMTGPPATGDVAS